MHTQLEGTSADCLKTHTLDSTLSMPYPHTVVSAAIHRTACCAQRRKQGLYLLEGGHAASVTNHAPVVFLPANGHAGMSQDESAAGSRGQLALITRVLASGWRAGRLRSRFHWRHCSTSQLSATARILGQRHRDKQNPCASRTACLIHTRGVRVPKIHVSTCKLPLPSSARHQTTLSLWLPLTCKQICRHLPSEVIIKMTTKI